MTKRKGKAKIKYAKSGPLLLIAAPGLIYLLINNYIPMFGIFIAFKSFSYKKGIFQSPWCGFKNFEFLFKTKDAFIMTRNTLLYNLAFIVLGTVLAIFIAVLLNALGESIRTKFFQSSLLLPNLMSWVIIAYMVYAFLNSDSGFFDKTILKALGASPVAWYMEKKYWPFILTFVYLWKNAGYMSIIYLAAIAGIDKSVYESASLDGATKAQQVFRITLPMLKPTVVIMTLMAVGRIFFSDFGLLNDVGMSSAAGLFQSILGFIIVITANAIVRHVDSDNALF